VYLFDYAQEWGGSLPKILHWSVGVQHLFYALINYHLVHGEIQGDLISDGSITALLCSGVDMRSCWLASGLGISLSVVHGFHIGGVFVGVVYVYHLGPLSMPTSLFIVVHLSLTYWSFSLSLGCHNMLSLTHLFFTFQLGALFPFLPLLSLGICL
jgi:hypothetical protein